MPARHFLSLILLPMYRSPFTDKFFSTTITVTVLNLLITSYYTIINYPIMIIAIREVKPPNPDPIYSTTNLGHTYFAN